MKKYLYYLCVLYGFCACSDNSMLRKIPADAEFAAFIDFRKIAVEALSPELFFENTAKEKGESDSKKNWQDTGIDFSSRTVIFSKTSRNNESLIFLILPLSDEKEFREFCLKKGALNDPDTGPDWLKKGGSRMLIQDDVCFLVMAGPAVSASNIREETTLLINLKEENNLMNSSEAFKTLSEDNKALGFWADPQRAISSVSFLLPSDLIDGELTGTVDFRSGALEIEAGLSSGDSANSSGILGNALSSDFLKHASTKGESLGLLAVSISIPTVMKILESLGFSQQGSMMALQYGLDPSEILEALSGELLIHSQKSTGRIALEPESYLQLGLKKPADAILNKLVRKGLLASAGGNRYRIPEMDDYEIQLHDNILEISNRKPENSNIADEELESFLLADPARILCMARIPELNRALADYRYEDEGLVMAKYWKTATLRIEKSDSGESKLAFRLECLEEDANSINALVQTLRELGEIVRGQKESPPVF